MAIKWKKCPEFNGDPLMKSGPLAIHRRDPLDAGVARPIFFYTVHAVQLGGTFPTEKDAKLAAEAFVEEISQLRKR
jgi:hypothetical protein